MVDRDREIFVALSSLREIAVSLNQQVTDHGKKVGSLEMQWARLDQLLAALRLAVDRLEAAMFHDDDAVKTRIAVMDGKITSSRHEHQNNLKAAREEIAKLTETVEAFRKALSTATTAQVEHANHLTLKKFDSRTSILVAIITSVGALGVGLFNLIMQLIGN